MHYFWDGFWELPKFRHFLDPWSPDVSWIYLKNTRKYGNIFGKCGFWKSENLKISKFSEVLCTKLQDFFFLETFGSFFFVFIFWFYNLLIWGNDEESKMRNFLRFILPAEFLEKLGYEFSFDQKTWNTFSQKRRLHHSVNCSGD